MPHGYRALFVLLAVLVSGCAGFGEATVDLNLAADALDRQIEEPGLLAATALLYHAQRGAYPNDAFGLLGSPAARETGLQSLGLSALALSPTSDGLTMRYTLLPTAADPSERFGSVTVAETDTVGTYTVDLMMERTSDPDFGGHALPLAQEGAYAVVRAKGSLCADVETVRARAGRDAGDPPLDGRATYSVTFTPADGTPASAALQRGVTVTLPR